MSIAVDVREQRQVEAMVRAAVEHFGGLHILVNSADVGEQTAFLKQTIEGFERIIAINLTGTFRCDVEVARKLAADLGVEMEIVSSTGASD